MSLRLLLLAILILAFRLLLAQVALQRPNPCRVKIVVTERDSHRAVESVTVQLMDAVGFSSAQSDRNTDSAGQAEFQSWTGTHRVRIYGPQIQEYSGDFDISPNESFHLERISVILKEVTPTKSSAGAATVSALRLKISAEARKEFEKARGELEKRHWSKSRAAFQAAIDLYPDYDLAYNGLGIVASEMEDIDAARQAFAKAIELNPHFAEAQRNLARIMLSEHNYQQAASLLNRSLDGEPMNAWALTNAAYAELQLKRFKEAADHALRVHSLPHEGLANAHVIAGYALEALGRQQEAAAQWELYLKEDPKGPNAKRAQEALARLAAAPRS